MNLARQYNVSVNDRRLKNGKHRRSDYVTFFEEGNAYMYNELSLVRQYYSKNRAFSGIGIHPGQLDEHESIDIGKRPPRVRDGLFLRIGNQRNRNTPPKAVW